MLEVPVSLPLGQALESAIPSWKRGVDVKKVDLPINGNGLDVSPVPTGGGGFMTIKPWWEMLPGSIPEMITRTVETPIVSPIGAVSKTIFKIGGMAGFTALGGFVLGSLLGGGGTQEQDQELIQAPDIDVEPDVDVGVDTTQVPSITPAIDTDIYAPEGRDVILNTTTNSIIYNIARTHTTTITPTKTVTITGATQAQEAKQEDGSSWITIAAVVLGAVLFLPKILKKGFL